MVVDASAELSGVTRWRIAFARVGTYALPAAAVLILGDMTRLALRAHSLAVDAANSYLPAARALLHDTSPYHPAQVAGGFAFASPPLAAFVFAPFTVLPRTVAEVTMALLMLGAVLAALAIAGVRDRRCFLIASVSAPLVGEFQTANVTALLALCAALLWRYRDRPLVAAAAAGVPVALKLFGWPMIVFLVVTRRFKAAAWATVFAGIGIVGPWAVVGFAGFGSYPHLLGLLDRSERGHVYTVAALVARFASWPVADAITFLVGGALLAVAYRARSSERAFIACIAAMLVLTPVLWMHYFVLLLIPIAIASPEFGPLWALPLAFWLSAREGPAHVWQAVLVLVIAAATFKAGYDRASPREPAFEAA